MLAGMNGRTIRYAAVGVGILALLIILGWFALRETPPGETSAEIVNMPARVSVTPPTLPAEDTTRESVAVPTGDVTPTNAAVLYRQAFALYDALSTEQQDFILDPKTNIDSSARTELCEKIRPICDLMHQASVLADCDWGVGPLTYATKTTYRGQAHQAAKLVIWSATHCHSNGATATADDVLSVLQLGRRLSLAGESDCIIDMAMQHLVMSSIAPNLSSFGDFDRQRLAAALGNPAYDEAPHLAMEQELDMLENFATKLTSPAELEKVLTEVYDGRSIPEVNRDAALMWATQLTEFERDAVVALASPWSKESEALQRRYEELEAHGHGTGIQWLLPDYDLLLRMTRLTALERAMVVAALSVVQGGSAALQNYPDPATGNPFTYTETSDGFELQSVYEANGRPVHLKFK
jgi:hypothetical protein